MLGIIDLAALCAARWIPSLEGMARSTVRICVSVTARFAFVALRLVLPLKPAVNVGYMITIPIPFLMGRHFVV